MILVGCGSSARLHVPVRIRGSAKHMELKHLNLMKPCSNVVLILLDIFNFLLGSGMFRYGIEVHEETNVWNQFNTKEG
jgi:hypothetical protein